nr:dsbD [Erythrocladia irregularis]
MPIYNLYSFIDNYIFYFKEYCRHLLMLQNVKLSFNLIIVVFILGICTSFNPCSISIIPIFFSYITRTKVKDRLAANLCFILGTFTNFIILGESAILIRGSYNQLLTNSNLVTGCALIFIGCTLLNLFPFDKLVSSRQRQVKSNFIVNSFFMGFSSGLVTSACNIPIIIALLSWLSSFPNQLQSFLFLLVYFFGYSLSIVFISILSNIVDEIVFFNSILSLITSAFGMFMVSNGTFLICKFLNL